MKTLDLFEIHLKKINLSISPEGYFMLKTNSIIFFNIEISTSTAQINDLFQ